MNHHLPDVALNERSATLIPLDWVGMQGIDLPVQLVEPDNLHPLHARVDVQVDLPDPAAKGIHMSRLYRLLDGLAAPRALTPTTLKTVLQAMVESHLDCQTTQARVRLRFDLLSRRPALITDGLSGWKAYPVVLDAHWQGGRLGLQAQVDVRYSSTCPCSAALSRQHIEQAFLARFEGSGAPSVHEVAAWIRDHASAATPHSQRSVARVQIAVDEHRGELGLLALIDTIEAALQTPVQTAVKRADEQAFAQLNGQNLMYVEDAARRIQSALMPPHRTARVFVSHQESLHPHDAVAWSSAGAAG